VVVAAPGATTLRVIEVATTVEKVDT